MYQKIKKEIVDNKYIYLFIFILFFYIICYPITNYLFILKILIIPFIIILFKHCFKNSKIIEFIIIIAIILRLSYMMSANILYTAHDLKYSATNIGFGNYGYMYNLYYYHRLPLTNDWQFYHPPLFYMLSTMILSFVSLFYRNISFIELMGACKIISCFASCVTLLVANSILDELKIKNKLIPILTISFLPIFFLMIGTCNNDALVTMFMFITVLYTYRWYKNQTLKNIVFLGLALGLGMMTKISCAILAFFILPIFIIAFIKKIKEKDIASILLQFFVFGIISGILGLWYPIRNYILFNQSPAYVPNPGLKDLSYIPLYIRLLYLPITKLLRQPFFDLNADTCLPINIIKTSLFDEFTIQNNIYNLFITSLVLFNILLLVLFNILLYVISFFTTVYYWVKNKDNEKYFMIYLHILFVALFIMQNIKMPYVCTANYRFIPIVSLSTSIYLSYFCDKNKNKIVTQSLTLIVILFSISSFIIYF